MKNTVVLAYSGGHASSRAIRWLAEFHEADVVTVTVDLGQPESLVDVRERALSAGAVRAHVLDTREEFLRDFVLPTLKADALSDGRFPMATAISRPLIAKKLVEIAHIENADVVAHAARERDRQRIDMPLRTLDPPLEAIACAEEWDSAGHASGPAAVAEAADRVDANAWGRTIGRRGDDASLAPDESLFCLTQALSRAPDAPANVEIAFERGMPVALNGVAMPLTELVESLATIAGEHGVGRLDRARNRPDGTRSRALYEVPAAFVLHQARAELERFVATDVSVRFSRIVSDAYVDVIDRGGWFDPLRSALDAFTASTQQQVSGTVRLTLYKGTCRVSGRTIE